MRWESLRRIVSRRPVASGLSGAKRVVAGGALLLLVRPLVFLVHDDEREVRLRGEQGAARTDNDRITPIADFVPHVEVLAQREPAVHHRDLPGEALCEAPDDEAATALSLSVSSRGNVRSETLRAFSFDEMKKILSKMV